MAGWRGGNAAVASARIEGIPNLLQTVRSSIGRDGGRRLSFGLFVLDRSTGVLLRGGEPLPIGKRGIRLLERLASRPGETIPKSDLLDAGWPGLAVEESNLSVQIALLRKTLQPSSGGKDWIETVPRIGYRFRGSRPQDSSSDRAPPVAVLPFVGGRDQEAELLADGLCDELTTALSRVKGLTVIARSSSLTYKGVPTDVRQVASELGARYVVEGSVRRANGRIRIMASLVDGEAGHRLWAERFDRTVADIFSVQDDVTRRIAVALTAVLDPVEASLWQTVPMRGTTSTEAYRSFLQGRVLQRNPIQTKTVYSRYSDLFDRSLAFDGDYAAPYAALAMSKAYAFYHKWEDDPAESMKQAYLLVDEAIGRDPHDAYIHSVAALVAMYDQNMDRWSFEIEQALSLDRNFAPALALRAPLAICSGQPEKAVGDLQRAIRLDPHFTHNYLHDLGVAHLVGGNYEAAIAAFRERILLVPATNISRAYLASALGNLGLTDEARGVWSDIIARNAEFRFADRISALPFRERDDLARIARGLERARLPEPAFMSAQDRHLRSCDHSR